jgi:hypothetical protein
VSVIGAVASCTPRLIPRRPATGLVPDDKQPAASAMATVFLPMLHPAVVLGLRQAVHVLQRAPDIELYRKMLK